MEYINLGRISIKPIMIPFKKGQELWFEIVFWTAEKGEEPRPQFHTFMYAASLEGLVSYLSNVIKSSKKIKTEGVFSTEHYERFGEWKKPEKEDLSYIG